MPRLLVFVPCEKIILDDRGNASLVILLQGVGVQLGKEETIQKNAITPKEWAVFTLWEPIPEDRGKMFDQVIQLLWPDGNEFSRSKLPFRVQEGRTHQNSANIIGFPVGQAGKLTLNMWLEEDSHKVGEVYSYPLSVSHERHS